MPIQATAPAPSTQTRSWSPAGRWAPVYHPPPATCHQGRTWSLSWRRGSYSRAVRASSMQASPSSARASATGSTGPSSHRGGWRRLSRRRQVAGSPGGPSSFHGSRVSTISRLLRADPDAVSPIGPSFRTSRGEPRAAETSSAAVRTAPAARPSSPS
jgi:hypothetical protein